MCKTNSGPKAWYQLNTDTPHHGFRDYRGLDVPFLTQSAVLPTLTTLSLSHLPSSPLRSLSLKWHRGERAERLCLLTGASEHLK